MLRTGDLPSSIIEFQSSTPCVLRVTRWNERCSALAHASAPDVASAYHLRQHRAHRAVDGVAHVDAVERFLAITTEIAAELD